MEPRTPGGQQGSAGPGSGQDLRASYDAVAEAYEREVAGELDAKPFDRELLDLFAARVRDAGPVADLGCGPGHVTAYLAGRAVEVVGVDVSPAMVERARRRNPDLAF